jgi:hypothetical protein
VVLEMLCKGGLGRGGGIKTRSYLGELSEKLFYIFLLISI